MAMKAVGERMTNRAIRQTLGRGGGGRREKCSEKSVKKSEKISRVWVDKTREKHMTFFHFFTDFFTPFVTAVFTAVSLQFSHQFSLVHRSWPGSISSKPVTHSSCLPLGRLSPQTSRHNG